MVKKSYSSFDEGKANSAFAKRLREEFLTDSVKVQQLADCLGCSTQAINQYKQGTSFPKMENLIKIAEFYNCSLDYLIGLSDVKSPEADLQSVCAYTGLSEVAIKVLHEHVRAKEEFDNDLERIVLYNDTLLDPELLTAVNLIIENATNIDFYRDFLSYIYSDSIRFCSDSKNEDGISTGGVIQVQNPAVDKYGQTYIPSKDQLESVALLILEGRLKMLKGIIRSEVKPKYYKI